MDRIFFLVFMISSGLFSIFCAIMNYDWFIENKKAYIFRKLLGRNGARVFYVFIGAAVIVLAVMAYLSGQI